MYEKELQQLGLSEKEAKVYIAALELGPDTAQNIAKKADVNRPTTYLQIDSLKDKGLMSEFEEEKKTFYVAESPDRIMSLLDKFEKDIELRKTEIGRVLPKLSELYAGLRDRPKVRFFEGTEGLQVMLAEYLQCKSKETRGVMDLDKVFILFPEHEKSLTGERIKQGIKSKIIYTRKDGPLEDVTDPAKLREAKYIDPKKLPVSTEINMYDDRVVFATYDVKKPIGIVIQSKEITDLMSGLFDLVWAGLK